MATTYLTFTPSGTGTSRRIGTFSAWVKRGAVSGSQRLWGTRNSAGSGSTEVTMNEHIQMWASSSSIEQMNLRTTAKYRDVGAWYHVVVAYDTTQAVETNRVKLYVNGVQNSTFSTYTNYPALNDDLMLGQDEPTSVGRQGMETGNDFNGLMAHVHYCDGTQYAASNFGETDATSGIWVPISAPSVTYGTNGFFLKFKSGALGTDSSGNGHTMTVGGTLTPTKDNAMNNFCTMNPLDNYFPASTFSYGNNRVASHQGNYTSNTATMAVSTGKWYYEMKNTGEGTLGSGRCGWNAIIATSSDNQSPGLLTPSVGLEFNAGNKIVDGTSTSYGSAISVGDIIRCAIDVDNNKAWFGNDAGWFASGDPAAGTNAITISAPTTGSGMGAYSPSFGDQDDTYTGYIGDFNFGNGYFGTTDVTSAVADGNGEGRFEFTPPTGFFALCTNNLGSES